MKPLRFDHVLISVLDLDVATANLEALGFTVFYGGKHSGGLTHNGLVVFADGGYLELMAPTDPDLLSLPVVVEPGNYLFVLKPGEGFAGLVLHTSDIEAEVKAVRARGLPICDPVAGGRRRGDGHQLAWRTAMLPGTTTPFYITDDAPRTLRVPQETDKTTHANGASGVAGVVVAVPHLPAAVTKYRAMLRVEPTDGAPVPGANTVDFALESFTVTLAAPDGADGPIAAQLAQRGETPYLLRLHTADADCAGVLELTRTNNARIELAAGLKGKL